MDPTIGLAGTLLAGAAGEGMYVKQFRINAQGQVIVTTIVPKSKVAIPFATLSSFTGYRQDITYSVNSMGHFMEISSLTFKARTYARYYLESIYTNLWNGGEVPVPHSIE